MIIIIIKKGFRTILAYSYNISGLIVGRFTATRYFSKYPYFMKNVAGEKPTMLKGIDIDTLWVKYLLFFLLANK